MTCIAWDGKVLAGDRMATSSTGAKTRVRKVHYVPEIRRGVFGADVAGPLLVGACGDLNAAVAFVEWLRAAREWQKLTGFDAVVVDRRRRIWSVDDSLVFCPLEARQHAIGSGRGAAMAAMLCGRSARGAVEVAAKIYCDVGLGIDVVSF